MFWKKFKKKEEKDVEIREKPIADELLSLKEEISKTGSGREIPQPPPLQRKEGSDYSSETEEKISFPTVGLEFGKSEIKEIEEKNEPGKDERIIEKLDLLISKIDLINERLKIIEEKIERRSI